MKNIGSDKTIITSTKYRHQPGKIVHFIAHQTNNIASSSFAEAFRPVNLAVVENKFSAQVIQIFSPLFSKGVINSSKSESIRCVRERNGVGGSQENIADQEDDNGRNFMTLQLAVETFGHPSKKG